MKTRITALIMALVMTVAMLPVNVLAAEPENTPEQPVQEVRETPAEPEEEPEKKPAEELPKEQAAVSKAGVNMQAILLTLTMESPDGKLLDKNGGPYQIQLTRDQLVKLVDQSSRNKNIKEYKIKVSGFSGTAASGFHPVIQYYAMLADNQSHRGSVVIDSITINNMDMHAAFSDYVWISDFKGYTLYMAPEGQTATLTITGAQALPEFDASKLTITKTLETSPNPTAVRQWLDRCYTITVKNEDSATGKNITVTDTMPSGLTCGNNSQITIDDGPSKAITPDKTGQTITWTIPELSAGQSAKITFDVYTEKVGVFPNTASVSVNGAVIASSTSEALEVTPENTLDNYGKDNINAVLKEASIFVECTGAETTHHGISFPMDRYIWGDVERVAAGDYRRTLTIESQTYVNQYNAATFTEHKADEPQKVIKLKFDIETQQWALENGESLDHITFTVHPKESEQPYERTGQTVYLRAKDLMGKQENNIYYGRYQQELLVKGNDAAKPEGYADEDLYRGKAFKNDDINDKTIVPAWYHVMPVKWRLLSNENGKLFLLADQVLETGRYNYSHINESQQTADHHAHTTTWATSTLRAFLNNQEINECDGGASGENDEDFKDRWDSFDYRENGFLKNAFSEEEQAAIPETSLKSPYYDGTVQTSDKVFVLTKEDTQWQGNYGFTTQESRMAAPTEYVNAGGHVVEEPDKNIMIKWMVSANRVWWTRTTDHSNFTMVYAGSSDPSAGDGYDDTTVQHWFPGIRPAFNIDKNMVLLATPAGEKKSGAVSPVLPSTFGNSDPGADWRLTILDEETFGGFNAKLHDKEKTSFVAGETVAVDFTGAQSGTDEYVSAVIANTDGNALYYGHISKDNANGTAMVQLPEELAVGTYKLLVFNEHCNEANTTDFGSKFIEFELTTKVGEKYLVTYDANGGENAPAGQTKFEGADLTLSIDEPNRDGWTFTGWNTAANGSGTGYQPGATYTDNAALTLYAQWLPNKTPVKPGDTVNYLVEHYKAGADGKYPDQPTETEQLGGKIGTSVTAVPKSYPGYHLNTQVSTVSGTLKKIEKQADIVILKLYYDADRHSSSERYCFAIRKVDGEDSHSINGAAFALYQKDSKGNVVNRVTAKTMRQNGEDGIALFYVGTKGTWYYTETSSPNGYIQDSGEYKVTVQETSSTQAIKNAVNVKNYRSAIPDMLNGTDHFAYIIGYEDGYVRPYGLISRAETTAIFFRLLKAEVRDGNLLTSNNYTDVADDYWANTAISTMTGLGIVQGRSATTFDPMAPITRAQFATICARFDTGKSDGTQSFTDIQGHWAQAYIERAAELGWIKGFEDNTFRPDTYITRAQAMTMINRVLNRTPEDAEDLLDGMNVWPDCNPSDWFYLAVQEATNSHDFKYQGSEVWTAMTEDPDWTRYEN